jgi:hypothetical protein
MMHAPKDFASYLRPEPDQPGFLPGASYPI